MTGVYVVGAISTYFGKRPQDSIKALTREAYLDVLRDAGAFDSAEIETCWFGNCGMWLDKQGSIRGQVALTTLVREGLFPERVPVTNVEGGCATASMAFNGACKDIMSGTAQVSLAMGVEKTYFPDSPDKTSLLYCGGIDQYDPQEWEEYYRSAGVEAGKLFEPAPDRTIFMDTYAMQASYHMKRYGTTVEQIAIAAAKNHCYGALNSRAQYRFEMTADEVLADRVVTAPLTRAMCAPVGDGAAAALLVSEQVLKRLPPEVQARAIRVAATTLSGGKYRNLAEPGLSQVAASKAYKMAGITPSDVDVAEVHDATSFCEIYQAEMLGFCSEGEGGQFVASGASGPGGSLPINTSGGLVSKGHPVGATGLSMVAELAEQLRAEAGDRQVKGARYALAENGGGVMGFDEAACSVIILEAP
jgi:acetyl-CoA acetyltransferase